jgi:hypothetical protein
VGDKPHCRQWRGGAERRPCFCPECVPGPPPRGDCIRFSFLEGSSHGSVLVAALAEEEVRPVSRTGRPASALEWLAERIAPAVTVTFVPGAGTLTILGDNLDNTITVSRDATGTLLVNGDAVRVQGCTPTVANVSLIPVFGLACYSPCRWTPTATSSSKPSTISARPTTLRPTTRTNSCGTSVASSTRGCGDSTGRRGMGGVRRRRNRPKRQNRNGTEIVNRRKRWTIQHVAFTLHDCCESWRVARVGLLDLRSEAAFASALKSDTPKQVTSVDGTEMRRPIVIITPRVACAVLTNYFRRSVDMSACRSTIG